MCDGEVDLGKLGTDFAIDAPVYFAAELAEVGVNAALASFDAGTQRIETTKLGRILVRNVAMLFDRYRHAERGTTTI